MSDGSQSEPFVLEMEGIAAKGVAARIYFARAARFSFAQELSFGTAFSGGPPSVPQAQGPSILASVMHEQDLVFMQAQT